MCEFGNMYKSDCRNCGNKITVSNSVCVDGENCFVFTCYDCKGIITREHKTREHKTREHIKKNGGNCCVIF